MKSRKRQKNNRMPVGCIMAVLFLAVVCALGVYVYKNFGPTEERVNLSAYYDPHERGGAALFLNYEEQESRGRVEHGQTYLPIDWVNANLNERFYWDENEKRLVYALPEEIVTATAESKSSSGAPLLLDTEEGVYLSLGLILNYTDVRIRNYEDEGARRVFVETSWDTQIKADVKWSGAVRRLGGYKSPILTKVKRGSQVTVLDAMENWSQVMTEDGHIGYMYNRKLSDPYEEIPVSSFEAPVYKNISLDEKITLVWHQVTSQSANEKLTELLEDTKGINVVVPTWFTLSDNEGGYESLASKSYVDTAHEKGLQVWAMVDNFSKECSKNVQSEILLSKTSVRWELIEKLMKEADEYGLDGINLDFESLKAEAGVHYVQFIREMSVACRKKGLVLSVDNYVPAAYNRFYHPKEQGTVADYVIIMGYDEHYAGGDAGSVSSIGFVEKGIKDMLEMVPKEKVINGVPFYTRLWTKHNGKTSSKALGISQALSWAEENGMKLSWDDESGQYYGELDTDEGLKMLWMEEKESLALKMNVIKEHDLAGVAAWKLGMEPAGVWDVIGWE